MLQEIQRSECGILFDDRLIRDLGVPTDCVPTPSTKQDLAASGSYSVIPTLARAPDSPHKTEGSTFAYFLRKLTQKVRKADTPPKETLPEQASKSNADLDSIDVLEPLHDQLKENPLWWFLQTPTWYRGEILCVSLHKTT